MSISHYLTLTFITERKYLNRYAKRKEYIKERGEEPSRTLQDLKTVESTLSQIRRRRARGTSGLWPSSP